MAAPGWAAHRRGDKRRTCPRATAAAAISASAPQRRSLTRAPGRRGRPLRIPLPPRRPACRRVDVVGAAGPRLVDRRPVRRRVAAVRGREVPGHASSAGSRWDTVTYFVGSLFFTAASFLSYREAVDASPEALNPAHRRFFVGGRPDVTRPRRVIGRRPQETAAGIMTGSTGVAPQDQDKARFSSGRITWTALALSPTRPGVGFPGDQRSEATSQFLPSCLCQRRRHDRIRDHLRLKAAVL